LLKIPKGVRKGERKVKGRQVYVKIQELKAKDYSQRTVKRKEGISRGSVRKDWDMSEEEYAVNYLECKSRFKILDDYREFIVSELQNHSEITGAKIRGHWLEHFPELEVSARTTREYVAELQEELGLVRMTKIRQYTEVAERPPGFQAQVDMGEKPMKDAFETKSLFSRRFWRIGVRNSCIFKTIDLTQTTS
jgi:16S rRNA C967 or C1407 C5-methylase (RsmB/RsmF family)